MERNGHKLHTAAINDEDGTFLEKHILALGQSDSFWRLVYTHYCGLKNKAHKHNVCLVNNII